MGWTIILEDENKEQISILSNDFNIQSNLSNFKLLCYLDPYGDTIFNRLQMEDLIKDFQKIKIAESNPLLEELELLAERCRREVHSYLVFYGN